MGSCSFVLLASTERQPLFDEVLEGISCYRVASVLEAVKQCVSDPPAAVLMDLASTLHSGVSETAPLYDLGIDLPILRCTGGSGAPLVAMCQAPFKREPLSKALTEIGSGDASWKHPVNMRKFVRINQNARVWFRKQGAEGWRRANCQSMSVSGLFLLTLDPEPVGAEIELRILDTGSDEVAISGSVIWNHKWEDGPHIPGSGVNFDRTTVPETFRDFLANSFFTRRRS
jgi:hypothetical protein